jgi:hypothetical protein
VEKRWGSQSRNCDPHLFSTRFFFFLRQATFRLPRVMENLRREPTNK